MEKVTGRRFGAYLIDMFLIMIVASMLASVPFLNPNLEKYNETYEEWYEIYKENVLGSSITNNDSGNDSMTQESTDSTLQNIDDNIDEKDMDEINEKLADLNYNLTKYGMASSIIQLVLTILYFVLFQFFNKGKTFGKAIMKINVVSTEKEKLKFSQVLIRTLIINSIAVLTLSTISFYIFDKNTYTNVVSYLQILDLLLLFVSYAMMIFRLDGKGLHDMLSKTNVVRIGEEVSKKEVKYKEKK